MNENNNEKIYNNICLKNINESTGMIRIKKIVPNNLNIALQRIDKAHNSGLVHKNKAARLKSRLTKLNNSIK